MLLLALLALPLFLTTAQDTFFEGDILLKNEVLSQRSLEMVLQDPNLRWPNGVVPYAFDALSKLSDSQKATVREAMDSIQEKTGCIEFVPVDEERGGDMLLITTLGYRNHPGTGCWAHLGRQGGTQVVNLGEEGCFNPKTVTHELLHVLGVIHEQTRPDRDDYIKIIEENIQPNKMHNFAKRNWSDIEYSYISYDYKSIMHYDMYGASKQHGNLDVITIQPHHEAFEGIGHFSETLSGIDAIKIALAYSCIPKPETLLEFAIDNAWQLRMVQMEHSRQIRQLKEEQGLRTVFSLPGVHQLRKNTLLTTLSKLGKEWKISFQFNPTSYNNEWTNLVRLTAGTQNVRIHGDRTPAVFFHPGLMHIGTTLDGNPNHTNDIRPPPPVNQWTTLTLSQLRSNGVYTFKVEVGGEVALSVENSRPREFSMVKVYASDHFYSGQSGSIRALTIMTQ